MTDANPPVSEEELAGLPWRVSSYGDGDGDSVEVARLPDGRTAMRKRNHPKLGTVVFTPAEMDAWIKGCKAGEFDDLR